MHLDQEYEVYVKHAFYHNIGELFDGFVHAINTFIAGLGKSGKVTLKYAKKVFTLTMPTHFILRVCNKSQNSAFKMIHVDEGYYQTLYAENTEFDDDMQLGFVYCSVIQESYINNNQSRLLAVVPISKKSATHFMILLFRNLGKLL